MAAPAWNYAADSEDEDVEEGGEKAFGSFKTVLLVMIDSTPGMFEPMDNGEIPFKSAIKCCQSIWRNKVTSNDKNLVSLVLVGTKESKNSSDFENIYQLQELSPVKVAMIEKLNAIKDSDDFDGFKESIGSSDDFNLKDAFWLAKIIIDEGKANTFQKKIIYFTKNDSPHEEEPNMQVEVVKKFKDIGKVSLTIVAFNDEFDRGKFYGKLVEDETSIIKAVNLDNLAEVVRMKELGRRPMSRSTLEIAPGIKIGVGFYTFARAAKPPQLVSINTRTNELVEKTVNEFRAETGMPVLKSEERKMVVVKGEKAIFTKEEVKQIKQVHDRGVILIGFLPVETFNHFTWFRSPGYFLYPDEERITGSRNLFVALLKRCAALKKIALVKMVLTRGKSPKLACLIPSLNDPLLPQGFHVFPVPFCDEMRKHDFELTNAPSSELITLMEKVIKKVTNKVFNVREVYNPALQYRWRELERIALDITEDEQDEFFDFTEPNEDLMLQRLGEIPDEIEKIVGSFSSQKSTASLLTTSVNMQMEVKHKRVEKLTVPMLKDFLKSKQIDGSKMRKAELVEAVYKYFEK